MSDRRPGRDGVRAVGRREVLGALAGIGTLGALSGVGTASMLHDTETAAGSFAGGALDLVVRWEALDGPDAHDVYAFGGPGSTGTPGHRQGRVSKTGADDCDARAAITLSLPARANQNPGYLWLRPRCPTPADAAAATRVEVRYADADGTPSATDPILSGRLDDLIATVGGVPLDAAGDVDAAVGDRACLRPGEDRTLLVTWTVERGRRGTDPPALDFEFAAVQCRHGTAATDPFAGVGPLDCEGGGEDCDDGATGEKRYGISYVEVFVLKQETCTSIGKVEVERGLDVGRTYDVGGRHAGYALEVTDVERNGDGEATAVAFAVTRERGDDPTLCRVAVKGGPGAPATYGPDRLSENATDGVLAAPANPNGRGGRP